ncbi:hypothetical protein FRB94_007403 [Tulasnella sp. JGI-2019a]|nr:hypothetical protein FRB94_007403 [Tulasnella sp. JGI-2019a]
MDLTENYYQKLSFFYSFLFSHPACTSGHFSSHSNAEAAFTALGVVTVASLAISFVRLIIQIFLWPGTSLEKFGAKQGAWAIITGCTDGIGRAFAFQLAEAGFNVVLLSRTQAKLMDLAAEIESQYKIETRTCAIDFALKNNGAGYAAVESTMSGISIGILVNNVGATNLIPTNFDEIPVEVIDAQLEVNIHATVRMTRMVLSGMMKRRNGLILNIGSLAGVTAVPMIATYSATKAFISTWSQCLAEEYRAFGITVQNVPAAFVVTKTSGMERPSIGVPMPKEFVRSVLAKIDVPCGSISVTANSNPYWSHALMEWAFTKFAIPSLTIRITHNTAKTKWKGLKDASEETLKNK